MDYVLDPRGRPLDALDVPNDVFAAKALLLWWVKG
jgi:hypothetical protein